jgi:cell division protein ZapE
MEVANRGRRIRVPEAAGGVVRFEFDELCSQPLSAEDYSRIAERFHTLILASVPILSPARRNETKRLINLIDTIYDKRLRLIVSAAAEPDALWQGEGVEAFEFQRAASRLMEMRSDAYWQDAGPASRHKKEAQAL